MKLKYLKINLLLVMLMMCCIGCQKKIEEPKVIFEDQTFQAVFDRTGYREVRGVPADSIPPTQSQLNRMTALNLYFEKGEECSLKDLKKFSNLRGLLLDNADQFVIEQVSEQKQLKVLHIRAKEPVDMSPLGAMNNIKVLEIRAQGEAGKFDWSFIGDMKQLETLKIEDIKLNDLNFVKLLPNLERLIIIDAKIEDITALETLSDLKYLFIQNSNNDYSPVLENMNYLEQLALIDVNISDWRFLKGMEILNWLSIRAMGNVHLPKWLSLENYPNLYMLDVDDDILNTNCELLEQIMPVLKEREKEKEPVSQLFDLRINFPVLLELMEPVEIYDD